MALRNVEVDLCLSLWRPNYVNRRLSVLHSCHWSLTGRNSHSRISFCLVFKGATNSFHLSPSPVSIYRIPRASWVLISFHSSFPDYHWSVLFTISCRWPARGCSATRHPSLPWFCLHYATREFTWRIHQVFMALAGKDMRKYSSFSSFWALRRQQVIF